MKANSFCFHLVNSVKMVFIRGGVMEQNSKNNPLLGCFEISIFMKTGVNHFDDDLRSMINSFGIVLLNFAFMWLTVPFMYEFKQDFYSQGPGFIALVFAIKFFLIIPILLLFAFFFCRIVKRQHKFVKYVTASNWLSLVPLVLFVPFFLMMQFGPTTYGDIEPFIIVISVYSYVLTAFMTRYVVDIPWELAVFMTVCALAINEASFSLFHEFLNYG